VARRKYKKRGWIKPEGMSKEMAERVLAGKICGARRNRQPGTEDSHFCTLPPALNSREQRPHPPYRCKHHSGAIKESDRGFKPGNKIGLKHGIYSDAMEPEEKEAYEEMKSGGIEQEIAICRMRLRRAMVMELRQKRIIEKGKAGDEELAQSSYLKESSTKKIEETGSTGFKSRAETAEVRMNVNYSAAVKDISNELYKYYQIQMMMQQTGNNLSDQERAKRVQEEIKKIEDSISEIEVAIEPEAPEEPAAPEEVEEPAESED